MGKGNHAGVGIVLGRAKIRRFKYLYMESWDREAEDFV